MSQKVCIGTKWPIFMVHQKKSRILEKTCQSVQKMLKLFKRVHTDLELCIAVLNSVGPLWSVGICDFIHCLYYNC